MSSDQKALASGQSSTLIPQSAEAITPAWLTEVLRLEAGLDSCVVARVTPQIAPKWNVAETAYLHVEYDEGASTSAPTHLFVKINHTVDPLADLFPGEQVFYRDARSDDLPVARCFAALRDNETDATCILLEDLSHSHVAARWPLPPTLDMCGRALEALATVHAHSWQAPSPELSRREDELSIHLADMLPPFFLRMGDRVPDDRRNLMRTVCARIPDLKRARFESGRPVTRLHGDAHFWNVLYPRDPKTHGCVLIDWEDWRVDTAASDLALMIALHWYPDRRARHEIPLLRQYWEALNGAAEVSMSWNDFMLDYRLAHLWNVIVPVYQEQMSTTHGSWWSLLECWFQAFYDLDCGELIE